MTQCPGAAAVSRPLLLGGSEPKRRPAVPRTERLLLDDHGHPGAVPAKSEA